MITLKEVNTDFLKDELRKRGYLQVYWHEDDVVEAIVQFGKEATSEVVEEIMDIIESSFDASVGINWDVIGVYVYEYYNPRNDEEN